jgi:alkylation response protein AidB-like acyl-CoA dehydrogenase
MSARPGNVSTIVFLVAFGILLARTDPSAPPHRGISCLLVDMRSPGITIRPLRQLTGSAEFSETFFDNVLVPRENLIGPENEGWRVATTTLAHERGTAFSFKEQVLHKIYADELAELLRARGAGADLQLRQRYAACAIQVEIMRLHNCRTMTRLARGELPGAESSIVKLFWADMSQELTGLAFDALGAVSQLPSRWAQRMLWSRCASIAGGTNEIQRNIIASACWAAARVSACLGGSRRSHPDEEGMPRAALRAGFPRTFRRRAMTSRRSPRRCASWSTGSAGSPTAAGWACTGRASTAGAARP